MGKVKAGDVVRVVGKSHLGEIGFRNKIGLVLEVEGEVEHPDKPFSREPACQVQFGYAETERQICFPKSSLRKLSSKEIFTVYEKKLLKIWEISSP